MDRSKMKQLGVIFILLSYICPQTLTAQKKKPITTMLNAKWSNTPLLLEAAEFLASESRDYFWSFIASVNEISGDDIQMKTDMEMHQLILELAARSLSQSQLDILRFSLSLRTESPKLEMYRHLANDRGVAHLNCPVVFDLNNKLHCDLPTILDEVSPPSTYTVDHVFPSGHSSSLPTVIMYGRLGTNRFAEAHNHIAKRAEAGELKYVLRHLVEDGIGKVRLSGYGVELQIKSTEYKAQDDAKLQEDDSGSYEVDNGEGDIEGFLFSKLNELYPTKQEKLAEMKQHLLDMHNDMAPMKVWQLQDLSMQAAERIMKSPPNERLSVMVDLAANFPSHARSLTRTSVSKEIKKEVKKNSEQFYSHMGVSTNDAALFINGIHYDMDYTDIFTILSTIREEQKVLSGLERLGLEPEQTGKLITLDLGKKQQTYGIDIRDSSIHWVNDIEKDKFYQGWPESVQELLRPSFPGMLRSIRKNFINIVLIVDPTDPDSDVILKLIESFYVHRAPTRIGLVLKVSQDPKHTGNNDAGVAINNAFNYIIAHKKVYDGLSFLTELLSQEDDDLTVTTVKDAFLETYGSDIKMGEVFGEDSEYDVGRTMAAEFLEKSGLSELPQVLMNGVPIDQKYLTEDDFEEQLLSIVMKETASIQKAVYRNELTDSQDVIDFLMSRENIMPRLHQKILASSGSKVLNMVGDQLNSLKLSTFSSLDKESMSATLINNLHYLVGKETNKATKLYMVSSWIVVDLDTKEGRSIALAAVKHVKGSKQMRLSFLHNTNSPGLISKTVESALNHMAPAAALTLISKILKEDTALKLESGKKQIADYDIPGVDMSKFVEKIESQPTEVMSVHRLYVEKVLKIQLGHSGVLTNGRLVGPLGPDEDLTMNDFELLEKLTMSQYGDKLVQVFHNYLDVNRPDASDVALILGGLLTSRTGTKARSELSYRSQEHSVIKIDPRYIDRPAFDIVAIVDPISRGAQKIAPVVQVLQQVLNANVRVFMNPVEKHSEMPLKSYYKVVLDPMLQFDDSGHIVGGGSRATFHNMPEQPILTQNYHVPDNWLVEPVKSVHDLDNIKLESIDTGVTSEWELGSILLEGHCFESGTGNPPRGLQLNLGTKTNPNITDTIVMANLGYFQLKADPGAWYLNLRDGRSRQIYEILSHENTDAADSGVDIPVLMNSFSSRIVKLKVVKKPEMKHEELLPTDNGGQSSGIWSSITSTFSTNEEKENNEGLNIFCLATGHLYERLLKIMMLSVLKHTKSPVKFWILKNFMSPNLKDFIPEYAEKYGFEYEYVQYKWPRWLNQQSEKQRTIWGYKILFLDVLFPLNLKKIIFVDTDQIVRTDLIELRDLDLGGAPYGYTPFCDSNKDMEGFRFWKQGYWRNHLSGRKYHISAIYVVDLVKFRQIAAGDRLRGQYQALSQDPNSLSNLDQDLPNNMIHQVPIKSLPQEWLWCETWCSMDELKHAKSIDLCNNPLTKEPKLSAARRLIPEWTEYDEEMNQLGQTITKSKVKSMHSSKSVPVKDEF